MLVVVDRTYYIGKNSQNLYMKMFGKWFVKRTYEQWVPYPKYDNFGGNKPAEPVEPIELDDYKFLDAI